MPNTTIQLKKSSTPSAKPADLANGELAINFADGKLFYKNTANYIAEFSSGGYSFGTVSANGVLLVADTTGDILTISAGNNINIATDSITDRLTIGLTNDVTISGSLFATSKSFVINHPTKKGMKLKYGSLEGPENGVYVRGELNGSSVIELPEYWWNLIDSETITVHITPCGSKQDLWIQSKSAYHINLNQPANCFYIVYAERKDVDKLIVEY